MKPSDDHALIQRALARWKASGRSRDALARLAGVDRRTFARWARDPQCVIRHEDQRAQLQAIADPHALQLLRVLEASARAQIAEMSGHRHVGARTLWRELQPQLQRLTEALENL